MSGNIVAPFHTISDVPTAEAFSEVVLRLGDMGSIGRPTETPSDAFPPVPAYLRAMALTYIADENAEGSLVRRQCLLLPDEPQRVHNFATRFMDAYEGEVTPLQEMSGNGIANIASIAMRDVGQEMITLARSDGLRTLAAFTLFSTEDDSQTFTAMLVPKRIRSELPLVTRNQLMPFLGDPEELPVSAHVKRAIKAVYQNDSRIADGQVAFATANLLPSIEIIRRATAAQLPLA